MNSSSRSQKIFGSSFRIEVAIIAACVLLLGLLSFISPVQKPFASAEVTFTDASARGLAIVPASCPSTPDFAGQCDVPITCSDPVLAAQFGINCTPPDPTICANGYALVNGVCVPPTSCPTGYDLQSGVCVRTSCPAGYQLQGNRCIAGTCTAQYQCSGSDLYYLNTSCQTALVQSCSWGCSASACLPPPPPSFTAFGATNARGNFSATGHLQAKPTLVRAGDTAQLYWGVVNATSCTITGSNGDSWSAASSGTAGQTSAPIVGLTTYTLTCASIPGATPTSITESTTVKVIPTYQEI